jgi:DNA adenine methylase
MKNGFIKYNAKLFHHSDELRLAVISHKLTTKNAYVMVSNSSHPLIRQMYDGPFNKYLVNRRSSIAADISKRGEIKELLVTNFDLSM